jgi:hypothetical protein
MAAGLGAESLATEFRAGDGLEGHLGRWLLLQVVGGDVEAEENLATSRQIPPIRTAVGEERNMEDIGTSWYPKGKSVTNRALLGAGLEVGDSTAALGVLLVEAESKLMELKYRGARAGGASDGMCTTCSACRPSARTPTGI